MIKMTCEKYKVAGSFKESETFDFEGCKRRVESQRKKLLLTPSNILRESKDPKRDIKILKGFKNG